MDAGRRGRLIVGSALMASAAVVFMTTAVRTVWYDPTNGITAPPNLAPPAIAAGDYPARIRVPVADIDAAFERLGLVGAGQIESPARFSNAGWYQYGPAPGMSGTAFIAGHLDNGLGLDGAFKHLDELKKGDDVFIITASGAELRFTVTRTRTYRYDSLPTDDVLGTANSDGTSRIVLVTCAGGWLYDPVLGMTYDKRLVVYAKEAAP